ncbi:hypothetical protein BDW62DRAFT_174399 [Aspergillus aurantiobrunneus]
MPPSPPNSKSNRKSTAVRLLNYTVFTFLSLILLCLILLTPADAIYQCYITNRLTNIFIITGGYVLTFLLAVLIYATRIYTNRSVLGGIPKAWIPVEKEDVGKSVRRLVVEGLGRSALVAWGARPRKLRVRGAQGQVHPGAQAQALSGAGLDGDGEKEGLLRGFDFDVDPANPPWGVIEHPGWSPPESSLSASASQPAVGGDPNPPLAGLCYRTVIRELPHLIEAKAVSLAPPDPVFTIPPPSRNWNHPAHPEGEEDWAGSDGGLEIPDTRVVAILRRPPTMSLRSYIQHLNDLSMLNPPEVGLEFLSLYERARFSGKELYVDEFRALMGVFADVLRGMRFSVDRNHLFEMDMDTRSLRDTNSFFGSRSESVIGPSDEEGQTSETETDPLGSVKPPRSRPRPQSGYSNANGPDSPEGSGAAAGGRISGKQPQWPRTPSASTHSLRPVRSNGSGSASVSSSSASRSGSGGSVIRLADARTESASGLPYVIGR